MPPLRTPRPITRQSYRDLQIIWWGFALAAVVIFFYGIHKEYLERSSLQWPKVRGIVNQSAWEHVPRGGSSDYHVFLTYNYFVGDNRYLGHAVTLWNPELHGDITGVKTFVTAHPIHSFVDVYYDPQNPKRATLVPGADEFTNRVCIWGGLVVFLLSAWLIFRIRKLYAPYDRQLAGA